MSIPLQEVSQKNSIMDVLLDTEVSSKQLIEELEEVPFRSLVQRAMGLNLLGCALDIPFEESRFFALL